MMFNTFRFLVFLGPVLLVYFLIQPRLRRLWLLVISICFYGLWGPQYLLILLFCISVTYTTGRLLGACPPERVRQRKAILTIGMGLDLSILFFFKYINMFIDLVDQILPVWGVTPLPRSEILLPIGISFYVFQSVGYMIDVYRGKVEASRDLIEFSLFVTFFPQLVAGPIERSGNLIGQLRSLDQRQLWDPARIRSGFYTMLWGYFMKTVIADRAAMIADLVFENAALYGSVELILGILCFSLQIYCDFGGYSAIAIGLAQIMGIELMENFRVPYFSGSIKEFWGRWHISLSTWFRDYLYIPLGGNRKGRWKKYRNLLIVFLVSGLWHGADWSFVVWGGLHGIYQIAEDWLAPYRTRLLEKYKVNTDCFSWRLLNGMWVFLLTTFAWIFFRADNIQTAIAYIGRIFTCADPWILFDGGIFTLGIAPQEMFLLLTAVLVLLCVDVLYLKTGKKLGDLLKTQNLWFRGAVTLGLICACVFFNCAESAVGTGQFIYFQF